MEAAPFFNDVADGPEGATAYWLTTSDSVRIRIAVWNGGDKGTVLLFPGRTEYVEKYGRAAEDLRQRGYSCVAIDWRGQGLADRLVPERAVGFVGRFQDYQLDVAALNAALPSLDLPGPHYLIAHSMGGCIGLRALMDGMEARAAAFSAPMWDIQMSSLVRPAARVIGFVSRPLGFGANFTPGTKAISYVATTPFEGNDLTTDADMFKYMKSQISAYPELSLGGPSLTWLHEAMRENALLARRPSPSVPAITFLGGEESIVCPIAIQDRMRRWPNGKLVGFPNARHEVIMEEAGTRAKFFEQMTAFFEDSPETGTRMRASA